MSYYILPKNNNNIFIDPNINSDDINICTSYSLYNFYNESKNQLKCLIKTDETILVLFKDREIINLKTYLKLKN